MSDLESLGRTVLARQPFSQHLGAELVAFEPGRAVLALEVSYALFDRVSFFFSGGLEMTFNRISYKAKLGNVEETVIKPFPVHPLIHLGFLVSLF